MSHDIETDDDGPPAPDGDVIGAGLAFLGAWCFVYGEFVLGMIIIVFAVYRLGAPFTSNDS